jgi:hypothetical protein
MLCQCWSYFFHWFNIDKMSNVLVLYQCHFKTCCYNVTLTSYQWLYQHWMLNILLRCYKSTHTKRGQVCDEHRDTLRYAHTRGGSYKPKVRQFDVSDFVYLQWQPNDILDTFSNCTIYRIKVIKPSGVLELQGANRCTIWDHFKNCAPCHLPNLDPTIITSTWIPPLDYPC